MLSLEGELNQVLPRILYSGTMQLRELTACDGMTHSARSQFCAFPNHKTTAVCCTNSKPLLTKSSVTFKISFFSPHNYVVSLQIHNFPSTRAEHTRFLLISFLSSSLFSHQVQRHSTKQLPWGSARALFTQHQMLWQPPAKHTCAKCLSGQVKYKMSSHSCKPP